MSTRTIRRARSTVYAHRWVCPRCRNVFPEQLLELTAIPTCGHGHTSVTMEPLDR